MLKDSTEMVQSNPYCISPAEAATLLSAHPQQRGLTKPCSTPLPLQRAWTIGRLPFL